MDSQLWRKFNVQSNSEDRCVNLSLTWVSEFRSRGGLCISSTSSSIQLREDTSGTFVFEYVLPQNDNGAQMLNVPVQNNMIYLPHLSSGLP